jgi:hypothetical protein
MTDMRNPLEITDDFWVRAQAPSEVSKPQSSKTGKWLIYIGQEYLLECWKKVRTATVEGTLGCEAKVATARPNKNALRQTSKVICVYTRDYENVEEICAVLARLRELGFVARLNYKEDEATHSGVYARTQSGPASLYTSPPGSLTVKRLRAPYAPLEEDDDDVEGEDDPEATEYFEQVMARDD